MKRFLRFSALLLISSFFLTSCGNEKQGNIADADFDFDGQAVQIVLDENNSDDFLWFTADSSEAEELLKRKNEIEKNYNCEIVFQKQENDIGNFVSSKLASNSNGDIDILISLSYYTRRWAKSGYLIDVINYSDIIDYTDSFRWGYQNDLETAAVDGRLYGIIPYCFPDNMRSFFYILVTNNRLMSEAGYDDMSVFQEENNWSRDIFEELIKNCAQQDKGIYSLDTGLESFLTNSVYASGGSVYNKDTDHTGLRNAGALDGLSWGCEILNKYRDNIYLHDDFRDKFLEGNAAMTTGDSSAITGQFAKNSDIGEFSLLPFPKGSKTDENTATGYIHSFRHMISIPTITDDTEASAVIINELFKPLPSIQNEEDLKQYYRNNVFWSDKDVEILFRESANAEYNYWQEEFHTVLTNMASEALAVSPSAAIVSSIDVAEQIIDKSVRENKEGFKLYFE